ncbi:MAG: fused MFS/spermidine synthase [Myxococcota bacterium]
MRELGLLFGNAAYAAATTLTAFFLGLAAGSWTWGRRAAGLRRPLRAYAWLELAVAASALLCFLIQPAYGAVYGPLSAAAGQSHGLFLLVKFGLALLALFPASFFMGGTYPVLSQHLVSRPSSLGRTGAALYATNTFGAALGAYIAGFHLPLMLGFRNSYFLALATTVVVGALAWWLGGRAHASAWGSDRTPASSRAVGSPHPVLLSERGVRWLGFLSGFVALGLEVLWTRMFAQVLQNSVYTFSIILVVFLVSLALGGSLAHRLARRAAAPASVLFALFLGSGLLVGLSPLLFSKLTGGLGYLGSGTGWAGYVVRVYAVAALVMGPPALVLGTVFPYLLKLSEPFGRSPGRSVGELAALNTVGGIVGSAVAGFVLLDAFGLWPSLRLMSLIYLIAGVLVGARTTRPLAHQAIAAGALLSLVSVLDPDRLPRVRVNVEEEEHLLEVLEGSGGTVAVVRRGDVVTMKLNNHYVLGDTGVRAWEEVQAHLPLLLHPKPRAVFVLGMGTGISAGAVLQHPVERVVVAEIVPEIIEAARRHFSPYVHGLFEDPRAAIVAEDGRNHLLATSERFDVILSDLFVPWKAGAGQLYSREHFIAARERLREGGIFAQWLPLYQMSQRQFGIVARTMLEAFPRLTLWRGDFLSERPIVALVGHRDDVPLDPGVLLARLTGRETAGGSDGLIGRMESAFPRNGGAVAPPLATFLLSYAGNLGRSSSLVIDHPLSTDDRPLIEYWAPVIQRREKATQVSWFVGPPLIDFLSELQRLVPPDQDPYLRLLDERERELVTAGLAYHRAIVLGRKGDRAAAERALDEFKRIVWRGDPNREPLHPELEELRQEIETLRREHEERLRHLLRLEERLEGTR